MTSRHPLVGDLPELPPGHFFRVKESVLSGFVELQVRRRVRFAPWWSTKIAYDHFVPLRPGQNRTWSGENTIPGAARELLRGLKTAAEFESVLGDYPNSKGKR